MSDRFGGFHVTLTKEGKTKTKPVVEAIQWFALVLRVETTADNHLLVVLKERRTSEGIDGLSAAISRVEGVKDVEPIIEDLDALAAGGKILDKAREELLAFAKEFESPGVPPTPTGASCQELRARYFVAEDIRETAFSSFGYGDERRAARKLADQVLRTLRDFMRK
jgi:hypothetical protein